MSKAKNRSSSNSKVEVIEEVEGLEELEPKQLRYFKYRGNTCFLPHGITLVPRSVYCETDLYANGVNYTEGVDSESMQLDNLLEKRLVRVDSRFVGLAGLVRDYNGQPFKVGTEEEEYYDHAMKKWLKGKKVGVPRVTTQKAELITIEEYSLEKAQTVQKLPKANIPEFLV